MNHDLRVRDPSQTVLTLRRDLVVTPRLDGTEAGYVLEDRVNSKFYRVGLLEYTFLSLLDGKTSLEDALNIMARIEPEHVFTPEQAATICAWLVDNQLAYTPETEPKRRPASGTAKSEQDPRACWNPLFLRIPLVHPDKWIGRALPWMEWLFTWPAALIVFVLALIASYQILSRWDQFIASSRGILSEDRWWWLAGAWLVVKVLHELAHALVCKRYGGDVREAGVILVMAAPVAYVDVSSSWRFRSKWQRIHTAVAGIYMEWLLATLAALLWSRQPPGVLSDLCFQIVIMSGLTTILFNANPLMRFDGYYVLSDLLEIPNLASQGQQALQRFARRWLLDVPDTDPLPNWRRTIIGLYGLLALMWRIFVCVALIVGAARWFHGTGVLLSCMAIVLWVAYPVGRALHYLIWGTAWEQPRRWRVLAMGSGVLAAAAVIAVFVPWWGAFRAPAIVDYGPHNVVRASSPGFVREVLVQPGEQVAAGQVLVVLENEELAVELHELRLRTDQAASRVRGLLYEANIASQQAEREKLKALQIRLKEREQEFEALQLRAPVAGLVVARDLDALVGTYLERGQEVLTVGQEDQKVLRILIAQEDVEVFSSSTAEMLTVRIRGESGFRARLPHVEPRASLQPQERALCAPYGGPLAVRPLPAREGDNAGEYELLAPRFCGTVSLDRELSLSLLAGQRGTVSLRPWDRSTGQHVWERLRQWWRRQSGDLPQVL